jgi:hypothetical protein
MSKDVTSLVERITVAARRAHESLGSRAGRDA